MIDVVVLDTHVLVWLLEGDPADRLIAATARHLDAVLVTADGKLLAYGAAGHLRVLAAT